MNKKGFTLIEILASLVIIGLISGIAIGGTTMYLDKTRQQAYDAMVKTLYAAAENYIIERGVLSSWLAFATKSDCIFSIFIDFVIS